MDSGRLQPALYGGLFIGVLSALPIVNMGNCCCCLWVVAGGALAVYLRQQNMPYAVTSAEGALMGLLAGLIGGVIAALISIPMMAVMGPFQQRMIEQILNSRADFRRRVARHDREGDPAQWRASASRRSRSAWCGTSLSGRCSACWAACSGSQCSRRICRRPRRREASRCCRRNSSLTVIRDAGSGIRGCGMRAPIGSRIPDPASRVALHPTANLLPFRNSP